MKRGAPMRRTKLRAVSPRRVREQRVYMVLRRVFLEANPVCQFPGCQMPPTDVHHKRGRDGALYLNPTHWAALCRGCHALITREPALAYDLGLSERRNGAA